MISSWIVTDFFQNTFTTMVGLQVDCAYSLSQKGLALAIIGSIAELGKWDIRNAKLAGNRL